MGKYDVIQTGNIYIEQPDAWKAAYNIAEKYLDPEYQNMIEQQEEEQDRYETQLSIDQEKRDESQRQYQQEFNAQENQRDLENKRYTKEWNEGQTEKDRSRSLQEMSYLPIENQHTFLSQDAIEGVEHSPAFVSGMQSKSVNHQNWKDEASTWYGYQTDAEKLAGWDSLQAAAHAAGKIDQLDKIRPEYERILQSEQYKNISDALTLQFPELVDTNVLSMLQSGTMSHEGLKSVAGIIDNALEKQGVLDDRKQSLAELLIGYGSDLDLSLATDAQLKAKNRANQLGYAMMERLAEEGPKGAGASVDYSGKLVPSGLYAGYQKDLKDLLDSDTVVVGGKRMTGSQFKEGKNRNLFSKEELAEMKIFDKNIGYKKRFFHDKGIAKQFADLSGRKVYDNKGKESSIKTVISGPSRAEQQAAPFWGPHITRDYPKVVVVEDGVEKEYSVPKFNEKFSLVDPEVEVPRKPDEDLLRQIDKKALEYGYTSKSTPAELEDIKYKILQEFPEYEMK